VPVIWHGPPGAQAAVALEALGAVVIRDHVDQAQCVPEREVIGHVSWRVKTVRIQTDAGLDADDARSPRGNLHVRFSTSLCPLQIAQP
jgi:hypothetical protein